MDDIHFYKIRNWYAALNSPPKFPFKTLKNGEPFNCLVHDRLHSSVGAFDNFASGRKLLCSNKTEHEIFWALRRMGSNPVTSGMFICSVEDALEQLFTLFVEMKFANEFLVGSKVSISTHNGRIDSVSRHGFEDLYPHDDHGAWHLFSLASSREIGEALHNNNYKVYGCDCECEAQAEGPPTNTCTKCGYHNPYIDPVDSYVCRGCKIIEERFG